MSESENESAPEGIGDEQLPDDLVPGDDNPLADGLDDGETVDDLLTGGKTADESDGADAGESATSQDGGDGETVGDLLADGKTADESDTSQDGDDGES